MYILLTKMLPPVPISMIFRCLVDVGGRTEGLSDRHEYARGGGGYRSVIFCPFSISEPLILAGIEKILLNIAGSDCGWIHSEDWSSLWPMHCSGYCSDYWALLLSGLGRCVQGKIKAKNYSLAQKMCENRSQKSADGQMKLAKTPLRDWYARFILKPLEIEKISKKM